MKKFLEEVRYGGYVITHPFDGFWCLKRENKGSIRTATVFYVVLIAVLVLTKQCTSFTFNETNLREFNIFIEILTVIIPVALWCIAGWSVTTLMDGEGTLKDIYISLSYALLPIIVIDLPLILLSHIISLNEGALYTFFQVAALLWAAMLIFSGTMTVHHYTPVKTILMIILTVIEMAIIAFLILLFFVLIQQLIDFLYIAYKELSLRLI